MGQWTTWDEPRIERLKALWNAGELTGREIAEAMGSSIGAIKRMARKRGIELPRKRRQRLVRLGADHPAFQAGTTLFPGRIVEPEDSPRLLVDGRQQRKLGWRVEVGAWAGFPFYALTLIERESCPSSCPTWAICYGNHMPYSRRHRLTRGIMPLLAAELDALDAKHRRAGGYVVRLHVLGDFGSPSDEALALAYVKFWRQQLRKRPMLHIFGYTAHPRRTPIGKAILAMTRSSKRCWIRFSGTDDGRFGSVVIAKPEDAPPRAIVCPYEEGKVPDCGHCGLCWKADRTIAFVEH